MENTTYRVVKRVEEVETETRNIYRVVLTPDDETHEIIVTVEALEGGDGPLMPVMPLASVWSHTHQPLDLDQNQTSIAMHCVVAHLAERDESILDDRPAW